MLIVSLCALADEPVYAEALSANWESWSWSGTYDFGATDQSHSGSTSVDAHIEPYGALSLHRNAAFTDAALRFWVEGDAGDLALLLEADGEGYSADPVPLTTWATARAGTWTEYVVDLTPFGSHAWTRIDLFVDGAAAVDVHVDDIELLSTLPEGDPFLGVEPVAPSRLLVYGTGDASTLTITLDGVPVAVDAVSTGSDPARSLLSLHTPLTAGVLEVTAADWVFTRTLTAAAATLDLSPGHPIAPAIYGVAFAEPDWVAAHGTPVVRWGGNATTLYNPDGNYTNLANDWYFENSATDDAGAWATAVVAGGASAFLSVPALDFVARDDRSCSYSVALYGAQEATDPWRSDCGNGVTRAGTPIVGNDPTDVGTPWSPTLAAAWLATLPTPPDYAAVDNEMDIASSTHRDVHPEPVDYDELYTRWYSMASAIKDTLPSTRVLGPSSCCWWYYWNSAAGETDKTAHGGTDLLPWWLRQVAAADSASGRRTLDYLDIHYYPNDVFNDDTSAPVRAERLRSTRSLWDPTYTDEGWIGTDQWATQTQPDWNEVQLIPRFKALVADLYPGTGLAIGEWNWGAEQDLSGGLAVADVLGIFGREGLDLATYWTRPPDGSPAAAAFALYRGGEPAFGDTALGVSFADPDRLGVYAAGSGDVTTLVVVNKDPDHDLILTVNGLPGGAQQARHFSAGSTGALVDDGLLPSGDVVVVPAYGALFLAVSGTDPTVPDDTGSTDTNDANDANDSGDPAPGTSADKAGCGCHAAQGGLAPAALLLAALLLRRRSDRGPVG